MQVYMTVDNLKNNATILKIYGETFYRKQERQVFFSRKDKQLANFIFEIKHESLQLVIHWLFNANFFLFFLLCSLNASFFWVI